MGQFKADARAGHVKMAEVFPNVCFYKRIWNHSFSDDRSPSLQFPPDARCLLRGGSVADSQAPPKTRFAWTVLRGPLLSSPPLRILPKHLPEAAGRVCCLISKVYKNITSLQENKTACRITKLPSGKQNSHYVQRQILCPITSIPPSHRKMKKR